LSSSVHITDIVAKAHKRECAILRIFTSLDIHLIPKYGYVDKALLYGGCSFLLQVFRCRLLLTHQQRQARVSVIWSLVKYNE